AIFWVAEDVKVDIKDSVVNIYTPLKEVKVIPDKVKDEKTIEIQESANIAPTNAIIKSSLPLDYCSSLKGEFLDLRSSLFRALVLSDQSNENDNALKLSQFFFCNDMFEEALGATNLMKLDTNFLSSHPTFPFYKSVLYSLMRRYQEANEILGAYINSQPELSGNPETNLWSKLNQFKMTGRPIATDLVKYINSFPKDYNDAIYWNVVFNELEILSITNDVETANQILQNLPEANNRIYGDILNYYRATFFKKQKRFNQAVNYYNSIQYDAKNPKTYIRSKFDKIEMLLRNRQIDTQEAIANLTELTFMWRGDKLEYDIWMKIADLNLYTENYLQVLRLYKYILDAFPDNPSMVYISQQMADIYNKHIFSENGLYKNLSDFQLVSLYYEFRELTPIGSDGDKITLEVTSRLIKLDLLEQAEKILDHQIKYRLDGSEKVITADHLALIYISDHKAEQALDLLNSTAEFNYDYNEHLERIRIKAKALLDLGKYNEVLNALKQDDSEFARAMKEEAYFQNGNWDNFIMLAEANILPAIEKESILQEDKEKEVMRLAIAYAELGKKDDLNILLRKLKTDNSLLTDSLKLLVSSYNSINISELDSRFKVNEIDNYLKSIVNKMFNIK
ncbi:MAG: hypothetical protein SFT68_04115, partial [Rickettsiaceae bacterium]|nr:hypothetical protein [Rickettsiaceae bacterium]